MAYELEPTQMMRFEANRKSALIAYLLWFFLPACGVHRMYLGKVTSGLVQLVLHGLSWVLALVLIGYLGLAFVYLWWLIDALLIPGQTSAYNNRLVDRLQGLR